jgi:phosphoribosyl-AMP cyclohydrolase
MENDFAVKPVAEAELWSLLRFDDKGLLAAIVQDVASGRVLMMAWMSEESLRLTLQRGETVFWSRSRGALWHKGDTSGNVQRVIELRPDCDGDTLLVLVQAAGPACHTGEESCFYRGVKVR